jgi:hypothetical protein
MIYPNAKYEIFVCDQYGNIVAPFNIVDFNLFVELSMTRGVGEIGACYIRLSGGSNSTAVLTFMARYGLLRKDTIIAIYRTVGNQRSLFQDTVWFIRSIEQFRESTGSFVIKITAYDTNFLLASRVTSNQFNGSPQTPYKNVTLSRIMYELVRDNIGSNANARQMTGLTEAREIPRYGYLIEHYSEKGMPYAYANLLTALQELYQMSTQQVQVDELVFPVYFDTVAIDTNSYVFQQFPNQRGVDRRFIKGSNKANVISDTMGHMRDVRFVADWQDEKTSVQGVWTNSTTTNGVTTQTIVPHISTDKKRVGNSPYSLREVLFTSPTSSVAAETNKYLKQPINYPVFSAYATLQDVPGFLYGIDWGYGDYLTMNVFGTIVDVRIDAITVTLTNKTEEIKVKLQASEEFSF